MRFLLMILLVIRFRRRLCLVYIKTVLTQAAASLSIVHVSCDVGASPGICMAAIRRLGNALTWKQSCSTHDSMSLPSAVLYRKPNAVRVDVNNRNWANRREKHIYHLCFARLPQTESEDGESICSPWTATADRHQK